MEGFPVTVSFPIHWAELDAFGHVNNARYFTWFETARIECFRRLGLATEGTPEIGPILAHTRCDFLAPVRYPADVVVGARIGRLGNTSFGMDYLAAFVDAPEAPVARGEGVVVLIDYASGTKVPIPDDLRKKLQTLS
jgi:acyl-CoA thioester hydrolase